MSFATMVAPSPGQATPSLRNYLTTTHCEINR
jgi:hypothetical protein